MNKKGENEAEAFKTDAKAAGLILREKRRSEGLTLAQVQERTTVPSVSYLGSMEAGRIHAGRSKHLPSVAEVLKLTERDLTQITGKPTLEGLADVREVVKLEVQSEWATAPNLDNPADLRNASPLTIATVVGGKWRNDVVGSYRLASDPGIILVVDPQKRDLEVGRHYLTLDPMGHAIVRMVCVQEGESLKLMHGNTVLEQVEGLVMGCILFEARPL